MATGGAVASVKASRARQIRDRTCHEPTEEDLMNRPSAGTSATTTFIVRFWREWTGTESRWRGRIEHVQQHSFPSIRVDFVRIGGRLSITLRRTLALSKDGTDVCNRLNLNDDAHVRPGFPSACE
jgi:hypothetical protein